jgi:hypothetical protein
LGALSGSDRRLARTRSDGSVRRTALPGARTICALAGAVVDPDSFETDLAGLDTYRKPHAAARIWSALILEDWAQSHALAVVLSIV